MRQITSFAWALSFRVSIAYHHVITLLEFIRVNGMEILIRNIGNSKGVLLPKPLLAQAGLDDSAVAEVVVKRGVIMLSKPAPAVREGWAQAAKAVAQAGDDALLLGEFANAQDADLAW